MKSQLQALRRRHPPRPAGPGKLSQVEFEYERGGTLAYMGAYEVHRCRLIGTIADKTGIVPFMDLVEKVMTTEPSARARRHPTSGGHRRLNPVRQGWGR